jgi:hypothetical protein
MTPPQLRRVHTRTDSIERQSFSHHGQDLTDGTPYNRLPALCFFSSPRAMRKQFLSLVGLPRTPFKLSDCLFVFEADHSEFLSPGMSVYCFLRLVEIFWSSLFL